MRYGSLTFFSSYTTRFWTVITSAFCSEHRDVGLTVYPPIPAVNAAKVASTSFNFRADFCMRGSLPPVTWMSVGPVQYGRHFGSNSLNYQC